MSARGADTRQAQNGLKKIRESFPGVGKRAGSTAAEPAASKMVSKVHVISGKLRDSIGVKKNDPYWTRVGADADYAFIEVSKGGEHDFFFAELVYLEEGGWANIWFSELQRSA